MNAALQCLAFIPPLANYLLSQECFHTCQHCSEIHALCDVESHFTWALHSPGDVIQPCQAVVAGFNRNCQEDAHEFLLMFDALRAAGLLGLHPKMGPTEDQLLRHQLVEGYWRPLITCLQRQGTSDM